MTCSVDGCGRTAHSRGWCSTHYSRWRNHGDPGPAGKLDRSGPNNSHWKGGRWVNLDGYVVVHAGTNERPRYEHRVVMESELGRPLDADEIVHHVNGDKADNRPENLELTTRTNHPRLHARQEAATS